MAWMTVPLGDGGIDQLKAIEVTESVTAVMRIAFFNQADVRANFSAGQRIARILSKRENTGLNRVVIGQVLFVPPVLEIYDLDP